MSDLADVRRNLQERMRSSGMDSQVAARMAEDSVRRVAEKKNNEPRPKRADGG